MICLTRIIEVDPRALKMCNWQSGCYREDTCRAEKDSLEIHFLADGKCKWTESKIKARENGS